MDAQVRKWAIQAAIGVLGGLLLGIVIGWYVWPLEYLADTLPAALRQDYRDDYIVMVATVYEVEANPEQAREQLAFLDAQDPVAPVVELAERLVEAGGSVEDITRLARLTWALGGMSPVLAPYVEGEP